MITGMPRVAIAVHDFDNILETFQQTLGLPAIDMSPGSVESLGAKLAMCVPEGGSNIELMCPADANAPLSQSLSRFLDRRGEGLFALMLEAPDPDAEAEVLLERGLNVLPLMEGAGGRDVHPNSTHGVLIRVYPTDSFVAPAGVDTSTSATTGLSGIARAMLAVTDIEAAIHTYRDRFGLEVAEPRVDVERGVISAICSPPSGGQIELLAVQDADKPFARSLSNFLAEKKEGLYALVLETGDLQTTARALQKRGMGVQTATDSQRALECPRAQTFGALVRIEQR
ncbi:MAG: VOC family protein [Pseudomonadales bacterium]|jgi:catechol 2,3-dioxygenase-like lactoylglutathione lyase family enzyme|nr:VOC family protein [Pseudomonadales bacterium]MDP6471185.1 VOC family protein [Pseudomonadales bacterium]MDP6825628.1 VOC family protein [Pseudomonadales bacterium]MDP6970457.1 VOC family protein [Pseudomonadales bacterium]|tara:strand:+ start:2244 stop:3095 length:852 start_codon:yes stop_codon:yes gene_type:complete